MQFQNVTYNFDKGIDTKSDVKIVQSPYLVKAQNAIVRKRGRLTKRPGTTNLPTSVLGSSTAIGSGVALATFQNELLLFDDASLYSYSPAVESWVNRGTAISLKTNRNQVLRNSYQQRSPDSAISGNTAVFAWTDSRGGVRASVQDLSTGAYLLADVSIASAGSNPKCFAIGAFLFVAYVDNHNLHVRRINTVAPTAFESAQTPIADVAASNIFDVIDYSGTGALVAYATEVNTIRVGYVTIDGFLGAPLNGFYTNATISEAADNCLTLLAGGETTAVYVAYHSNSVGMRIAALNTDLTVLFAPTALDATTSPISRNVTAVFESNTSIRVFWEYYSATSSNARIRMGECSASGTVSGVTDHLRSVGLASKAWRYNNATYVAVVFDSTLQSTYFVADSARNIVGKSLGTVSGGLTATPVLPRIVSRSATQFYFAALEKGQLRVEGAAVFALTGVTAVVLDFDNQTRFSSAVLGKNLHFVGGIIQAYDGAQLFESGFHTFPESVAAPSPSGTGGSITSGSYAYRMVYEWTDNQGQIHRSAPSDAQLVNVVASGSAGSVTVTIPTLRLTARAGVVLTVYRTLNNGSIYYKVTSISSPTYNDKSVDSVSYVDTVADASIVTNQILYTDGGELDNDAPPGSASILAAKNRLFVVDDQQNVWFSKEQVPGSAVEFSLGLTMRVDPLGGDITGLSVLDDKVVITKAGRILAFAGDGPTPTGDRDTFSEPQVISADVGADNQNSFVIYDAGLMFKNAKGVFLLGRDLQINPAVGIPVYDYRAQEFTSATLIHDENEIRFTTSNGEALIYNFVMDMWTTFSGHESQDALIWQDTFCHLKSSGIVAQEDTEIFTDNGNSYAMTIETAWMKWASMQGFQRISKLSLLGDYVSAHTLVVQLAYDYQDAWIDTLQFTTDQALALTSYGDGTYGAGSPYGSGEPFGGSADSVYQFRASMPRQKLQSLRLRIYDSNNAGEAYDLTAIDFLVGSLGGLARLRSAKSL